MAKKIISPMQYSGTTDSELFEFWFEHCLLSCVSEGQVIVMDNAPFHRKEELSEIAKKYKCRVIFLPPYSPEYNYKCRVIFLPPYSPEYNPIEKSWANLKKYLKYNIASFNSLDDAISSFFQVH